MITISVPYSSSCIPGSAENVEITIGGGKEIRLKRFPIDGRDSYESFGTFDFAVPEINGYEIGISSAEAKEVLKSDQMSCAFDGDSESGAVKGILEWTNIKLFFKNGDEAVLTLPDNPEVVDFTYLENGKFAWGGVCEMRDE